MSEVPSDKLLSLIGGGRMNSRNPVDDVLLARIGFRPDGPDSIVAENCKVRIGVNHDGDGWFIMAFGQNGNYLNVPFLRRNMFTNTAVAKAEEVA